MSDTTVILAKRVLLVDDSPSDILLAKAHIERANKGWHVLTAESGEAALATIADSGIDLVVTDLRMPVMDGLQLLAAIRKRGLAIPVIVITARGSESLAVEALTAGAASYVPKSQIADVLVESIEQVFGKAEEQSSYISLIQRIDATRFQFTLENDPTLIGPLADLLQEMAYGIGIVDEIERRRLGIALEEAVLNAMYHGNLELPDTDLPGVRRQLREGRVPESMRQRAAEPEFGDRRVHIEANLLRDEAQFVVRDQGPGFRPTVAAQGNPTTLEREGGRGLVLMTTFMDEVRFNDKANEVTMVKRCPK